MEVHVVTVLLILALIQVAQSSQEEFNLTTCSQTRMPCIRKDTTEVPNFIKENITVEMQIVLPFPHLTELWHNDTKICIVGSSGTAINFGKELKRKQDEQRYELNFYFTRLDTDWGELYVELHVTDVNFIDTHPLRLELRLEDITYVTKGTDWMPVKEKNIPVTSADPWVIPVTQWPNTSSESGQEHVNMTKPMDTLSGSQKGNGWKTVALTFIVLFCISLAVNIMVLSFKLYGMYKDKQQYYLCHNPNGAPGALEAPWTIKEGNKVV